MGGVFSNRMGTSYNTSFWGFDQQLDFRKKQLEMQNSAKSAQQMNMLAQLPLGQGGGGTGGGGGGGGGGMNSGFNNLGPMSGQLNITQTLKSLSPWCIIGGGGICGYVYFQKLDATIMFIGAFLLSFFVVFYMSHLFNASQTNNMMSNTTMLSSAIFAAVFSFIASFVIYKPGDSADVTLTDAEIAMLKLKAAKAS